MVNTRMSLDVNTSLTTSSNPSAHSPSIALAYLDLFKA